MRSSEEAVEPSALKPARRKGLARSDTTGRPTAGDRLLRGLVILHASQVDFDTEGDSQLHYWRKHPDLHGWMENLYREKGGAAESFNCVPVVLAAPDLDRLEADIKERRLPETQGFFFGESDGSETPYDLTFIDPLQS